MKHTSKKRRNKKIQIIALIALVIILIGAFIISRKSKSVDMELINSIAVVETEKHIKGDINAPITLVEYSDFQCPACKSAAPQLSDLLKQFEGKFNMEFRHFPLRSIHGNAQLAGQAAEAAAMQGKFWEMHDELYEHQTEWAQSFKPTRYFKKYAEKIGLNIDRFVYDMESDKVKNIVNAEFDEATKMELPGTPSFTFNGEKIEINEFIATYLNEKETDAKSDSSPESKKETQEKESLSDTGE